MTEPTLSIDYLWKKDGFKPNAEQEKAILHTEGPLYLTAGPGSGKTRVLLWRTLNLIVFHDVAPEEIFLSTFTEKAALQLREGLQALLGIVTNQTGKPYDLTPMFVGTVHSLCQRIITDRSFSAERQRTRPPRLLDELGQYFHLYRTRNWTNLTSSIGLDHANATINKFFSPKSKYESRSRHYAVTSCMGFFNRLSEECTDPHQALQKINDSDSELLEYLAAHNIDRDGLETLLRLYDQYRLSLLGRDTVALMDFALLQQVAYEILHDFEGSGHVFKHVIVDEYQDTNTIQERLFFKLAAGHKNICVVGDDDQALYRFRGATVENFVQFPQRCQQYLGLPPRRISLSINYRSLKRIVDFYTDFITHCDWCQSPGAAECYRVADKDIQAHRTDDCPSVVATSPGKPQKVFAEIATLVRRLIDEGKVENPNQIAFLFPSIKYRGQMSTQVRRMKDALEGQDLQVYAPRAGRFLEVDEAVAMFGVLIKIFGTPRLGGWGGDYEKFCTWLRQAESVAEALMQADDHLTQYVEDRQAEIAAVVADYQALLKVVERNRWDLKAPYHIARMKRPLYNAAGLSERAKRSLSSTYFERIVQRRIEEGNPPSLSYVINRAASVDWNVLDLFYRICGFEHFKRMFDLAQSGKDEGPICNLGLLTQYLARFTDEYVTIITAELLAEDTFQRIFFMSYLYALYRLGESEYEDAQGPFPKGRVPFLTIHQSKGLEFPVVVLANPRKDNRGPQRVEQLAHPFLDRKGGEPLDRMADFDIMRMFYVALSRAKNLLVIAHLKGRGQRINKPFQKMLDDDFPRLPNFDLNTVPRASLKEDRLPQSYSYTSDYLKYRSCPRQYMIFRKYGFVPSRSQTMFFGSLVHRTLDDLHNYLIARKAQP